MDSSDEIVTLHNSLHYLRAVLKVQSLYLCRPLNFDLFALKFSPINYNFIRKFFLCLIVLYFCSISFLLLRYLNNGGDSETKLPSVLFWAIVVCAVAFWSLCAMKLELLPSYLNTLLHFEKTWFDASVPNNNLAYWISSLKQGLRLNVAKLMFLAPIGAQIVNPLLMSINNFYNPCTAPLLKSTLISDCPSTGIIPQTQFDPILKLLFFSLDSWGICLSFSLTPFTATYIVFLGAACLREGLKKILIRKLPNTMTAYRELQVIAIYYNEVTTGSLPTLMITMVTLGLISLYSCIALHDIISTPLLLFWATLAFEVMVLVHFGIYSMLGKVYEESKQLLGHWKGKEVSKERRKMLKSLIPIKVKFGSGGNFLEMSTSLEFNKFTVEQAISLVLMNKLES